MGGGLSAAAAASAAGVRERVVCLHSNASTSAQWRPLAAALSGRFDVVCVDGRGVGASPPWPAGVPARLEHAFEPIEPLVADDSRAPVHLVGHSFGGAVALLAAASHPRRVRSLVVYEPTLFSLVVEDGGDPARSPAAGIWRAAGDAARLVEAGDPAGAAECFVDFWSGTGTFASMPAHRRAAVAASVRDAGRWREATFHPSLTAPMLAAIDVPVLLLHGDRSPEASLAVARRLGALLPRATTCELPGLGHMGPVVDPGRVDAAIADFLGASAG